MIFNIVIGVFKLPYIAYSDYKYEHDTKYREMITKKDEDEYQKEKARITSLKEELNKYIQKDLSQEPDTSAPEQATKPPEVTPAETQPAAENKIEPPKAVEKEETAPKQEVKATEPAPVEKQEKVENKIEPAKPAEKEEVVPKQEAKAPEPVLAEKQETLPAQEVKAPEPEPAVEKPVVVENKTEPVVTPQAPAAPEIPSPVAVILARPAKGFSPLKVDFYGTKSHSPNGRIVSYEWDFGDGDTSSKPKASNTYWSTTYGARNFTVTLTVKDIKGATASTTQIIEVMNK
jgi:hypothetical protein